MVTGSRLPVAPGGKRLCWLSRGRRGPLSRLRNPSSTGWRRKAARWARALRTAARSRFRRI